MDEICKYAGIDAFDTCNGVGCGTTLFVQGCSHHCRNCHNPETWAFDGGKTFDKKIFDTLFSYLSQDSISRLTISGGEPFDNISMVCPIVKIFKEKYPNKKLWIYSGYAFEELSIAALTSEDVRIVLCLCDVLVDGEFQCKKKDPSLAYRGSTNQRIIDVQKSLKYNQICFYDIPS